MNECITLCMYLSTVAVFERGDCNDFTRGRLSYDTGTVC